MFSVTDAELNAWLRWTAPADNTSFLRAIAEAAFLADTPHYVMRGRRCRNGGERYIACPQSRGVGFPNLPQRALEKCLP